MIDKLPHFNKYMFCLFAWTCLGLVFMFFLNLFCTLSKNIFDAHYTYIVVPDSKLYRSLHSIAENLLFPTAVFSYYRKTNNCHEIANKYRILTLYDRSMILPVVLLAETFWIILMLLKPYSGKWELNASYCIKL